MRQGVHGFVIAVGSHAATLTERAPAPAARSAKVPVEMGDTEFKVSGAAEYFEDFGARSSIVRRRKYVKR